MLVDLLIAVVVALAALPALALGSRGLVRHGPTNGSDDVVALVVLVTIRLVALLLLLAAAALTLLSTILAAHQDVELHGFVYVFFVLALVLAAVVVLTFGRPSRRRAHRRVIPAPK